MPTLRFDLNTTSPRSVLLEGLLQVVNHKLATKKHSTIKVDNRALCNGYGSVSTIKAIINSGVTELPYIEVITVKPGIVSSLTFEFASKECFDDLDQTNSSATPRKTVVFEDPTAESIMRQVINDNNPIVKMTFRLPVTKFTVSPLTGGVQWREDPYHTKPEFSHIIHIKEPKMKEQTFVQSAATNLSSTSKSVVNDALDVATGMAAVEVIKQLAFSVMPVKVGFIGRMMGANSWVKNNAFVTLGIVTVVHTVLKSSNGRLTVNDHVMGIADNALRYATFKAVEAMPINKLIQDLSEKLTKISGK
jgi:hypothetical protein